MRRNILGKKIKFLQVEYGTLQWKSLCNPVFLIFVGQIYRIGVSCPGDIERGRCFDFCSWYNFVHTGAFPFITSLIFDLMIRIWALCLRLRKAKRTNGFIFFHMNLGWTEEFFKAALFFLYVIGYYFSRYGEIQTYEIVGY